MARLEKNVPTTSVVLIVMAVALILVFSYAAFKSNPMLSYAGLTTIIMLAMLVIIDLEWNPLHINPTVIGGKGEIGSLVVPLTYIGALQYRCVVSCRKRYVPKDKKGYLDSFAGFTTIGTGNVNIELRGFRHDFMELPSCGTNPEGALLYLKGFDGEIPEHINKDMKLRLDELASYVQKQATIAENFKSLAIVEAKEQQESILETAKKISTVVKQLQSNVSPMLMAIPQQPVQGGER